MRRLGRPAPPEGPYLVVGLARSGVAAAQALRGRGELAIGVDAGEPPRDRLQALADAGIEVHLNESGLALCPRANALIKSPGVPRQAPVIERALAEGKPVIGELELGWRLLGNEAIAVTGTNGKTTTVEWIGHIHRRGGLPVAVAGNVGRALTGLVGRVDPEATIVCEASSFQLEDTVAFAPEAAVLLNIAPDHLDRHRTIEAYAAAKLKIFERQTSDDLAIVPAGLDLAISGEARRVRFGGHGDGPFGGGGEAALFEREGTLWWRVGEDSAGALLAVGELGLRGRHNVQNAMAAAAVCLARGVDLDAVREGLRTFRGVKHRLEEVARRDGVLYVNDSKATNVASTLVALDAFKLSAGTGRGADIPARAGIPGRAGAPDRIVHLILGGQGKGQDFASLREPIETVCAAVYLIGEDAPLIAAALTRAGAEPVGTGVPIRECGELEHALEAAAEVAKPGDVVLLSPACASFDQFEDYEERGERFRELVRR